MADHALGCYVPSEAAIAHVCEVFGVRPEDGIFDNVPSDYTWREFVEEIGKHILAVDHE